MAEATLAPRVALVDDTIEVSELQASVVGPEHGAVSLFLGVVRNTNEGRAVTGIDYEAYRPMALAELQRIVDEVERTIEGVKVAVVHRLGELSVGDVSVAIAAAHARRASAQRASSMVIEELKRRVPIWKREHYVDGAWIWVDPSRSAT